MVAPRRRTRKARNSADALTVAVRAVADAASKNKGVNQEITFPGGRMVVMIGAVTISVLTAKGRGRKP